MLEVLMEDATGRRRWCHCWKTAETLLQFPKSSMFDRRSESTTISFRATVIPAPVIG